MYRVYCVTWQGWREFGIDYPSRAAAKGAAANFRPYFKHARYIVRRVGYSKVGV